MHNDSLHSAAGPNPPDWEAVARYLAGESSPDEQASVHGWMERHPGDRAVMDRLDAAASAGAPEHDTGVDAEAALRTVHARMAADPDRATLSLVRGRRWRGRRSIVGITAVAAAAGVVAVVTVRRAPDQGRVVGPPPARAYSTAVGQRDSVTLADGSRVMLGPDSRLTVPADYGVTTRTVALRGDGYFDVHHDGATPFVVHAGDAVIEDIGTRFTIESDALDTTTVSVLAGSVRLRARDSATTTGAILLAGDRGSVTTEGAVLAAPHTVGADDAAWTTGRLVFRDASLVRVAGELRRWYGVNIRIADSA
ncbi:MAG TPA: FecR domain-containing protein, partial [Gemmatimonadaceae bacterium]